MSLTDLFLATPAELSLAFRGWKRSAPLLGDFVERTKVNPFTRAAVTVRTLVPDEQPEADPDAVLKPNFLQLPRIDQKGLGITELEALASAALGWDKDRARSEVLGRFLHGPAESEAAVLEISPELVQRLSTLASSEFDSSVGRR
jgi:hypothetical protein